MDIWISPTPRAYAFQTELATVSSPRATRVSHVRRSYTLFLYRFSAVSISPRTVAKMTKKKNDRRQTAALVNNYFEKINK